MEQEKLEEIFKNHESWLRGAGGERANLRNADLENANLRNADLENADLENANLWNANLWNADLRNANLRNADLRNANLRNANLWNANLWNANLRNADLRNANLRNADLRNADLWNANLENANLWNANLSERILQVGPIGSRKNYTVYFADRDYVQCGCWNDGEGNHLASFKKRVEEVYPIGQYHDEYMAVIAMFEKFKEMSEKKMEG